MSYKTKGMRPLDAEASSSTQDARGCRSSGRFARLHRAPPSMHITRLDEWILASSRRYIYADGPSWRFPTPLFPLSAPCFRFLVIPSLSCFLVVHRP